MYCTQISCKINSVTKFVFSLPDICLHQSIDKCFPLVCLIQVLHFVFGFALFTEKTGYISTKLSFRKKNLPGIDSIVWTQNSDYSHPFMDRSWQCFQLLTKDGSVQEDISYTCSWASRWVYGYVEECACLCEDQIAFWKESTAEMTCIIELQSWILLNVILDILDRISLCRSGCPWTWDPPTTGLASSEVGIFSFVVNLFLSFFFIFGKKNGHNSLLFSFPWLFTMSVLSYASWIFVFTFLWICFISFIISYTLP